MAAPRWKHGGAWPQPRMPARPPTTRRSPHGSRTSGASAFPPVLTLCRHARADAALRRESAPACGILYQRRSGGRRPGVATARQVQGKALSYNNLNDTDAAFECVAEFETPTVVIVKHANPCGVALRRAGAGVGGGAALRPGFGVRRHRRGQSRAGRGDGRADRGHLHRGDRRPRRRARAHWRCWPGKPQSAPAADRRRA